MDFIETPTAGDQDELWPRRELEWDDLERPHELLQRSPPPDDNLKWALGSRPNRMVNIKFTKELLDTEMTVAQ